MELVLSHLCGPGIQPRSSALVTGLVGRGAQRMLSEVLFFFFLTQCTTALLQLAVAPEEHTLLLHKRGG